MAGAGVRLLQKVVQLPRAQLAPRIARLEAEQQALLASLQGTFLDLKTFVPLALKHCWCGKFPSAHQGWQKHRTSDSYKQQTHTSFIEKQIKQLFL